jgi:hypothetical protein
MIETHPESPIAIAKAVSSIDRCLMDFLLSCQNDLLLYQYGSTLVTHNYVAQPSRARFIK